MKLFSVTIITSMMLWLNPGISHAAITATGLVAYFDFNSDTAADTSGALGGSASTNDGSWTGSAVYKDGAFGRAAEVGDGAGSNFITSSGAEFSVPVLDPAPRGPIILVPFTGVQEVTRLARACTRVP